MQRDLAELREAMIREESSDKAAREKTDYRFGDFRSTIDKLLEKTATLESKHFEASSRLASIEERIKSLERQSDRHWQVWLALGSAITALLVAFLRK